MMKKQGVLLTAFIQRIKIKHSLLLVFSAMLLTTASVARCAESRVIDEPIVKVLDATVKCGGANTFSPGDGYFNLPDYGCMYSPKAKYNLGLAEVFIIEKKPQIWNSLSEDAQIQKVNAFNTDQIKDNFDVYIYMVDKKYLQYFPQGDSPYEARYPYMQQLYHYDGRLKQWVLTSERKVTQQNAQAMLSERDQFIRDQVKRYGGSALASASSTTTASTFIADPPQKKTIRLQQAYFRSQPDKFDPNNILGVVKQDTEVTVVGHQKVGDTVWFLVSVQKDRIFDLKKNDNNNHPLVKGWLSEKVFLSIK